MNLDPLFRPITLQAKAEIQPFLEKNTYRNCDFSFANMCSWQFLYQSQYAIVENWLLIRFRIDSDRTAYMFPLGSGDIGYAISLLEADAAAHDRRFLFLGIDQATKDQLDRLYPGVYLSHAERDYSDYIYLREELIELRGKKLQPKRNHINKFRKSYSWEYTPLTPQMIPLCLEVEEMWCKENRCAESLDLENERASMEFALTHFEALTLRGGAILVEGKMVAFTYGAPITQDTFGVHVEKGDTRIEGIYSVINQQFAAHIPPQYTYVNREEDLGIPGLRQAKLSYQPEIILEKYAIFKKGYAAQHKIHTRSY